MRKREGFKIKKCCTDKVTRPCHWDTRPCV